ncbi:MAG: hypothetical protein PHG19_10875 [Anaerotignum sp.]|nr:hypothetical protein [Anaerotignum sp.]
MKNTLKLSNYLFEWFFHKYERYILGFSLGVGVILLFVVSSLNGGDLYEHFGIEFRTYDLVVDYCGVGVVFFLGLIILCASIFIQTNSFYTNGKGMYSIFTLPMKRGEVFFSFFLSATAAVLLYFAVWLIVMVLFYFPITGMYEKAAAKAVLYISEEVTLKNLDVSITNGLFLAFHRSIFLSAAFPVSWIQALALGGGMFLSITAIVFAGLYNEYIFVRVGLFLVALGGFCTAFYRVWIFFESLFFYTIKTVMPESLFFSVIAMLLAVLLLLAARNKLKQRKDI